MVEIKSEEQRKHEAYMIMKLIQTVAVGAICIGNKLASGVPVPQTESDAFALEGQLLIDAFIKAGKP